MDRPSGPRWSEIERLLDQALDLPPEDRPALLERACCIDPQLRVEVERWLRAAEAAGDFLSEPAPAYAAPLITRLARGQGLDPGERLGLYQVMREVGRGGMAAVYLVHDFKHDRQVALKVMQAELGAILGPERFLREIRLTARLQHPHILPVFDSGETQGLLWYTMPYIEGESLRRRLDRERRLPVEVATRIAREVAEALDYAHRHGAIHRDIKPENILLEDGQAVVADFGIALAIGAAGEEQFTQTGILLGTPTYMSPEQVAGEGEVDGRSDIYSLGCVLYEMLAGDPPFTGTTSQATMLKRCIEAPPRVRTSRSEVPPAVDDAVNRALAPKPDGRFSTAAHFAEALSLEAASVPGVTDAGAAHPLSGIDPVLRQRDLSDGTGRVKRRTATRLVLLFAGFLLIAGGLAVRHHLSNPSLDPKRVVVAVFANRTGDPSLESLGSMATDWVTQGVAQASLVDVVDAAAVHVGGRTASGQPLEARELARLNGASLVISGSYYRSYDSLVFQSGLTDVRTGRVLKALDPISGSVAQPLETVEKVRQGVIAALATLVDPRFSPFMATNARLPNLAAYQQFVVGQEAFWQGDYDRATASFRRATELDSGFLVAPVWLATTRSVIWDCATTDSVGRALAPHRDQLNKLDLLLLDRMLAWCQGKWEAALHLARRSAELQPHSTMRQFMVGFHASFVNRPGETAAILHRLDVEHDLGWMSDSARMMYWTYLTGAYHSLGDYRTELAIARRLRERLPDRLAAVYYEARALAASGSPMVIDRLDRAARLESEPGLYTGLFSFDFAPTSTMSRGWVYYQIAAELQAHGQPAAMVRAAAERAVAWCRDNPAGEATPLRRQVLLARSLELLGSYDEAEAVARAIPDTGAATLTREWLLGVLAARRGDRAAAQRADSVLARAPPPDAPGGRSFSWRAEVAAILGDRSRAVALLREGRAHGLLGITSLLHHNPSFAPLRGYPPFDELVRIAHAER